MAESDDTPGSTDQTPTPGGLAAGLLAAEWGQGWLVLVGGGEFSFGETEEVDREWLAKAASGPIGFIPAASGSQDYGQHFAAYLKESFARELDVIPIYRDRDARRGRNAERIANAPAVYLGGGLADQLLDAIRETPASAALVARRRAGGVIVAIAAAAQACGTALRGLGGSTVIPGLGWLPAGVVETNFDPGHDRRLRQLLTTPGVKWGLGIPAGSSVSFGPGGVLEVVGDAFVLDDPDGDLRAIAE